MILFSILTHQAPLKELRTLKTRLSLIVILLLTVTCAIAQPVKPTKTANGGDMYMLTSIQCRPLMLFQRKTIDLDQDYVYVPTHIVGATYSLRFIMYRELGLSSTENNYYSRYHCPSQLNPAEGCKAYWRRIDKSGIGTWQPVRHIKQGPINCWEIDLPLDGDLPEAIQYYGVFNGRVQFLSETYTMDFTQYRDQIAQYRYRAQEDSRVWLWTPQRPYTGDLTLNDIKEWEVRSSKEPVHTVSIPWPSDGRLR